MTQFSLKRFFPENNETIARVYGNPQQPVQGVHCGVPFNPPAQLCKQFMTDFVGRSSRLVLVALVCLVFGCQRPTALLFALREEARELPRKHQEEIDKTLRDTFGTPVDPTLNLPTVDENGGEAVTPTSDLEERLKLRFGEKVYAKQCQGCHGVTGDGNGPAAQYLNPLPRDYRLGRFKFTSTPRGIKPMRDDLRRIIRHGAKGTSMPAFRWLPDEELEAVIDYVVLLSSRGETELALIRQANELGEDESLDPEQVEQALSRVKRGWERAAKERVLPITAMPAMTEETIREGATAFIELNCFKCHGKDGRGNREFNVGKDDWGHTAFAADLTSGMLHGGRRPVDIYRRIYSGINGTPMPAFKDPDETKGETPEQRSDRIWRMVHFVTAIVEGRNIPQDAIEEALQSLPKEGAVTNSDAPSSEASAP
jgi:mono/diheme cytochrome c family protein